MINDALKLEKFDYAFSDAIRLFRAKAFEVEENPEAIMQYMHFQFMQNALFATSQTCLQRAKIYEALGYGDAGVLLACPGPSLAGMIVDEVGNDAQKYFFHHYVQKTQARTFLAVTEPQCGSNLSQMKTTLTAKSRLTGEKWLVGHGASGTIGVVIARESDKPLGVCAVLLTQSILKNNHDHPIERSLLPMVGLKGARLGRLIFRDVLLTDKNVLGLHLKPMKRGMAALIKTFNRMRPCVGALAIGVADAIVDYLSVVIPFHHKEAHKKLNSFNRMIVDAKNLIYSAAEQVEKNPFNSGLSSLAKVKATFTIETIVNSIPNLMGKFFLVEHPYLEKWYRDAYGFEFMEGTENIQKINIFNAYRTDSLGMNFVTGLPT